MTVIFSHKFYNPPLRFSSYQGKAGHAPHKMPFSVYFSDTDPYGVVWHGSFAKYLEKARVELFKSRGIEMYAPQNPQGNIFCIKHQEQAFHFPARYGDPLEVETIVDVENNRKLVFTQTVKNTASGQDIMTATSVTLVVDQHFNRVAPIPNDIVSKLA